MRRRQVVRGLVPTFALWLAFPHPLHAQGATLVAVAEAYTAAWNAHDLPAVLARFAPDAVVRERTGVVPADVWDTRDPRVVRAYLDGPSDPHDDHSGALTWMMGHRQIAAWAAGSFARHSRLVADPYRAAGDTVGWSYQEFADPFQQIPGVGPVEGEAEAVVRGGRIAVLSLVQAPASVRRRRDGMNAAARRAVATRIAAPTGDEPSVRLSGPPRGAAEPTGAAWPLGLGGLALLAGAAVARRRRRGGNGGAERNRTISGDPMQP